VDFDGTSAKAVPAGSNDRTIVIWFKHFDTSSGNMLAYGLLGEGNSVGFAVNVVTDELFVDNGGTAISLEGYYWKYLAFPCCHNRKNNCGFC